ncbi:hypothetical protein ACHAW6_008241 [Cyclotella cf. meneghiniana]
MNFELESSSSSDIDNVAPRRLMEALSSSEDDYDDNNNSDHVDESLIESIRSALHFAVGNVCKEQDRITSNDNNRDDTAKTPSFTMSPSAIASLTDLTFHYSTTLLANDLLSFSSHAGRKAVKAEDVMLMARKDKTGIGVELKRKMKEIHARGGRNHKNARGEGNNQEKAKRKSAAGKKSLTKMPNRDGKNSGGDTGNAKKHTERNENKRKPKSATLDSSSDDEEDALLLMRQRVKNMERKRSSNSHDDRDDGADLNDFIVDDNEYYNRDSDGEVEFQLDSEKRNKGTASCKSKKKSGVALFNSSRNVASKQTREKIVLRDSSDSDSSLGIRRDKRKKARGSTEAMAIDLDSD